MDRRFLTLTLFGTIIGVSAAQAGTPLPKDPHNAYGAFENGFSYIIRMNKNPSDRVAFFLNIKTGALNETDSQNGLAHFLEHMSFNGSKHFAAGELIPYMNKLGMQFGADSNAHTAYSETVYKLFMPDTKPETIEKALTIFEDFVDGLLLEPEEIGKERHVILEEARARKSAAERIQRQQMKKVFADTRVAAHDIIGDEKQIEIFPSSEFKDYWDTWYRPENMTLIVVGEIKSDEIVTAARKHFADFRARGTARVPSRTGIQPVDSARAFIFTDPEQVMAGAQIEAIQAARPPMKTVEDYRVNEIENLGTWIVSRRLREMVDKGTSSFRGASVSVILFEKECSLPSALAYGEPEDWNKMLEQLIVELSRATEHGFSPSELGLAKKELLAESERALETEPTRDARAIINALSRDVSTESPILSAEQQLELRKSLLKDVSAAEVHRVFNQNFKTRAYTYCIILPEKKGGFSIPTPDDVLSAAKESWARKTEIVKEEKKTDSLMKDLPPLGKVVERSTDEQLKITTGRLSNGVVFHHRYMDDKKDEVLVKILIPGGTIEETAKNRGIGEVASLVFSTPATSRLDSTQIRDFLIGKKVQLFGWIGMDALEVSLSGSPTDLETGFQLSHLLLTDGRIEKSALDNWKKGRLQQLEQMKKTPEGHFRMAMDATLGAGDVRICELTRETIDKQNTDDAIKWLSRVIDGAPAEVSVVGDISLQKALELICRYAGSLPEHTFNPSRLDALRKLARADGPYTKLDRFDSITPKAMVLAGCLGCDDRDAKVRRLLTMSADILSDRMIKRIREDEQLVYGIACRNQPAVQITDLSMFYASAPTDPKNAEKLADTILEMIDDFAKKGPTDEEVVTAKKKTANYLETTMKEPNYWLYLLGDMAYRGRTLTEIKELPGIYQTFDAKALQSAVAAHAKPDRMIRMVIVPVAPEATSKPVSKKKPPEPAGAGADDEDDD